MWIYSLFSVIIVILSHRSFTYSISLKVLQHFLFWHSHDYQGLWRNPITSQGTCTESPPSKKIPYFKIQVFLYSQTIREEKLFKYDNKLSWLMVSATLITVLIVKAFMLKEEVWCWSHSRFEGAMSREYSYFTLILCWSQYLVPSPIHRMLLWSYEEDIRQILPGSTSHYKFFRDFCTHNTKTWNVGPTFSSFNPFSFLPSVVTDNRKQFQCQNIVLNNKIGPLFVELYWRE